jgi:ABC-type Fe3+/spermidine/putrescine transport system ATPase subunit
MQNSVEIKDLDLQFGAVKVLQNLNLEIGKGEFSGAPRIIRVRENRHC